MSLGPVSSQHCACALFPWWVARTRYFCTHRSTMHTPHSLTIHIGGSTCYITCILDVGRGQRSYCYFGVYAAPFPVLHCSCLLSCRSHPSRSQATVGRSIVTAGVPAHAHIASRGRWSRPPGRYILPHIHSIPNSTLAQLLARATDHQYTHVRTSVQTLSVPEQKVRSHS